MRWSFAKYEGLGNDFILIEADGRLGEIVVNDVQALCKRHRGIGADGVLCVGEHEGVPWMRVFNSDGSVAEMCGNGIRCVALYLAHRRRVSVRRPFTIQTDAGPHRCTVLETMPGRVQVEMAIPTFEPEKVPVRAHRAMVDAPIEVAGDVLRVTALSVGNPHAVTFDAVGEKRHELGPALEQHPSFPNRVNVGFVTMHRPDVLRLRVWERGVGWTRACGTGACAAAVAAIQTGRARRDAPLRVRLPGGTLIIEAPEPDAAVQMTGPARRVFEGQLESSAFGF